MAQVEKITTVNKVGGENMSRLDQFLDLVRFLKTEGEAPVFVISAFKGVTNELLKVLDDLSGENYYEDAVKAAFEPVLATVNGKIDEFIDDAAKNRLKVGDV